LTSNASIPTLYTPFSTLFQASLCTPSGISDCIYKTTGYTPSASTTITIGDFSTISSSYWATETAISTTKIWIKNGASRLQVIGNRRVVVVVGKGESLVLHNGFPLLRRLSADWCVNYPDGGSDV
jgi:hypothetical protein